MMRVLVTGATGFVGRVLVPALQAEGFQIRAAVRDPAAARRLPHGVEICPAGDIGDVEDWRPLLAGVAAVVHLAAIAHTGPGLPESAYDRINRAAAVRLAAATVGEGARFVFVSSVRAQSGPAASKVLTEADPPQPIDAYGRAKLAAETEIAGLGGPFVILRPTLVYGPGVGGNMAALVRLAATPLPLPFGGIENRRSLLAIDNLVAAIRLALTETSALGRTLLVADPDPVSLPDTVRLIRRGMGRPERTPAIPAALLRAGLASVGRSGLWERIAGDLEVSTAAIQTLGYRPATTAHEALVALGAAYRMKTWVPTGTRP